MIGRMGDPLRRQVIEPGRRVLERRDPARDDHPTRAHTRAIVEIEAEPARGPLDGGDHALVEIRHSGALDPGAVVDEVAQRHGLLELRCRSPARSCSARAARWSRSCSWPRCSSAASSPRACFSRTPSEHRRRAPVRLRDADGWSPTGRAARRRSRRPRAQAVAPGLASAAVGEPALSSTASAPQARCARRPRPARSRPSLPPIARSAKSARRRHQALTSRGSAFHALSSPA